MVWEQRYSIKLPVILIGGCASLIIGMALAKNYTPVPLVTLLIPISILLMARKKRSIWMMFTVCCLGLMMGNIRGGEQAVKLAKLNDIFGRSMELQVTAISDAVYGTSKQLTFDAKDLTVNGQNYIGKIAISGFGENMVYQGDRLIVSGKLRTARGSYAGRASFAAIKVLSHHQTLIDTWRRQFAAGLTSALPEPLAPFGMGLLIGQRNTLPPDTSNTLLWVGLTHIIAVSGYNLTILLQASRKLLARGSKYQVFTLSVLLIGVFLLFAGNSPSIVRAAVVSIIGLIAWYYGRQLNPVLLILLAAVITAWANPAYVWSDSGWYLSFLAFFGVVVVAPLFHSWLPDRISGSLIGGMILESICAEFMTTPYVLHIFGQTSVVALLSNMVIASFVPLAMLATLVAGLAGMFMPLLAGWFAWPASIILNYMLDGCRILSRIPHVFIENVYLKTPAMTAWYSALGICCLVLKRRKSAIITDI